MNLTYSDLYNGWINHEKELMKSNNFKEDDVYKSKRSMHTDYVPDFRDALFAFWDWDSRIIQSQNYNVYESKEVLKTLSTLAQDQVEAYHEIKQKFIEGASLNPYQRHLDKKLYKKSYSYKHAGIEHLHLNKLGKNTQVTPCKHIMFIRIVENNVYFIDIAGHKDFHSTRPLEIIDNNWPGENLLLVSHLPVTSENNNVTPSNIKNLRVNNVNFLPTVNGKVVFTGYMVNAAGGMISSTQRYNKAIDILNNLLYVINTNMANLKISNKVLRFIPIGYKSGIVIFDADLGLDGYLLLYKHNIKVDLEYLITYFEKYIKLPNVTEEHKIQLFSTMKNEANILFIITNESTNNICWIQVK